MTKQIKLPMGPQHPALDGAAGFLLTVEGSRVVDAVAEAGYSHRGIEKACEGKSYQQDLYLIERISSTECQNQSITYCQCVEQLAEVNIPRRAAFLRSLTAELERLQNHLLWFSNIAHLLGVETLSRYCRKDREPLLQILSKLGNGRAICSAAIPGGVMRDLDPQTREYLLQVLDDIEKRNNYYLELLQKDAMLGARMYSIGRLEPADARNLGVVGPVARACGIARDVRADDSYAAYDEIPIQVVSNERCDVMGRALIRLGEIKESVVQIRWAAKRMPSGPIAIDFPERIRVNESLSRTEGPRGENMYYIRSNNSDRPDRVHLRTPSLANWQSIPLMLKGSLLADVPIIIASVDPCYSGIDRCVYLNGEQVWSWSKLCQYSKDYYAQSGYHPEICCD